jgi:hypothetical protein
MAHVAAFEDCFAEALCSLLPPRAYSLSGMRVVPLRSTQLVEMAGVLQVSDHCPNRDGSHATASEVAVTIMLIPTV